MSEFTQNSDLAELGVTELFGGTEKPAKKEVKAEPKTTEEAPVVEE